MRPTRERTLIDIALVLSARSTCSRLHVGAVIAREGRILSTGYNGAPAGMPHCDHTCRGIECREGDEFHEKGCPAGPCKIAVHAEANALAYAARWGISTMDSTLVTTYAPCLSCSQIIVNSGIREVLYQARFRDMSGSALLIQAGLKVVDWSTLV